MSGSGNQGVQFVPHSSDLVVHWSSDVKLHKVSIVPREQNPNAPASSAGYIVNCPAVKSELRSRIQGINLYILDF